LLFVLESFSKGFLEFVAKTLEESVVILAWFAASAFLSPSIEFVIASTGSRAGAFKRGDCIAESRSGFEERFAACSAVAEDDCEFLISPDAIVV